MRVPSNRFGLEDEQDHVGRYEALAGGWKRGDTRFSPQHSPWSDDPIIIGATGGSGTRVLAKILAGAGTFIGADLNHQLDALPLSVFFDIWINLFAARGIVLDEDDARCLELPMARSLSAALAQHWGGHDPTHRPWGWKAGRSIFLVPFFHGQFPRLRFVHLVRDGRDMAFAPNQAQLHRHGSTYFSREEREYSRPLQSIVLWSRINLAAAQYGERELGNRYLRMQFEALCADPVSNIQRLLDFAELDADAKALADLVQPPSTIGRWRQQDPRLVRRLHRFGREALRAFEYTRKTADTKSPRATALTASSE